MENKNRDDSSSCFLSLGLFKNGWRSTLQNSKHSKHQQAKTLPFWEQLISFEGFCQLGELFGSQDPWFGPGASGIKQANPELQMTTMIIK